jgi:hypothetical protein
MQNRRLRIAVAVATGSMLLLILLGTELLLQQLRGTARRGWRKPGAAAPPWSAARPATR